MARGSPSSFHGSAVVLPIPDHLQVVVVEHEDPLGAGPVMGRGHGAAHLGRVVVLLVPDQPGREGPGLLEEPQSLGHDLGAGSPSRLHVLLNGKTMLVARLVADDEDVQKPLREPAPHVHALRPGLVQRAGHSDREGEPAAHPFPFFVQRPADIAQQFGQQGRTLRFLALGKEKGMPAEVPVQAVQVVIPDGLAGQSQLVLPDLGQSEIVGGPAGAFLTQEPIRMPPLYGRHEGVLHAAIQAAVVDIVDPHADEHFQAGPPPVLHHHGDRVGSGLHQPFRVLANAPESGAVEGRVLHPPDGAHLRRVRVPVREPVGRGPHVGVGSQLPEQRVDLRVPERIDGQLDQALHSDGSFQHGARQRSPVVGENEAVFCAGPRLRFLRGGAARQQDHGAGCGRGQESAAETAAHASSFSTTLPPTSVSRKSRPWKR